MNNTTSELEKLQAEVLTTMQLFNQTQLFSKNINEESENVHNQAAITLNTIDELKITKDALNNVSFIKLNLKFFIIEYKLNCQFRLDWIFG